MKDSGQESQRVISRKDPLPARMGSYQILSRLAEGGMGTVYYARHTILGGMSAVKVIKSQRRDSSKLVARFQAEAQALARIKHENVIQVLDVGEQDGQVFIAMDLAQGMDLRKWIKRDGPLGKDAFVHVARQIIDGIAAAHEVGVLHRDIKPDNVIVDQAGMVKITDFGLADDARVSSGGTEKQTFATIAYAAPEVLRGETSDARSDVFSLSATLWQVFTGALPFGKDKRELVLARHAQGIEGLKERLKPLPPTLARAIAQGFALDPAERPQDALEYFDMAFPEPASGLRWPHWLAAGSLVLALAAGFGLSSGDDPKGIKEPTTSAASEDEGPERDQSVIASKREGKGQESRSKELGPVALAKERSVLAEAAWKELAPRLVKHADDLPRRIELLHHFAEEHIETRPGKEAQTRFEGLAAVFERQRASAFTSLREGLEGLDGQAALARLKAFPIEYRRPLHGVSTSIATEFSILLQEALVKAEAQEGERQAKIKALAEKAKPYEALNKLEQDLGRDADRALYGTLSKEAKATYQKQIEEDEAYFQQIEEERALDLKTLGTRLRDESRRIWRQNPKTQDDFRETTALVSLAQHFDEEVKAAWLADVAERDAAYAWFLKELEARKGQDLVCALAPDEAPRVGTSAEQKTCKIKALEKERMVLIPRDGSAWKKLELREFGVAHWLRFASEIASPKADGAKPSKEALAKAQQALMLRITQIPESSKRAPWLREVRRVFPKIALYRPMHHSLDFIARLEVRLLRRSPAVIGESALTWSLESSQIDLRPFVIDATSGSLYWPALARAAELAPKSFRVARALARYDLEVGIPEQVREAKRKLLQSASETWSDEWLWRWHQKFGK